MVLGSERDSFTYLLTQSYNKHLLKVNHVSGAVLGTEEMTFDKTVVLPASWWEWIRGRNRQSVDMTI